MRVSNNVKAGSSSSLIFIGYTWPSTPTTSREPSVAQPIIAAAQSMDAMEWTSAPDLVFDEAQFASILNEIEEWGFLQNFGDIAYPDAMS